MCMGEGPIGAAKRQTNQRFWDPRVRVQKKWLENAFLLVCFRRSGFFCTFFLALRMLRPGPRPQQLPVVPIPIYRGRRVWAAWGTISPTKRVPHARCGRAVRLRRTGVE